MSETVIKIENLSKQYRLGTVGSGTLRGDFQRWTHRISGKEDPFQKIGQENKLNEAEGEYVWALKEINLEVKRGEVLGIIGKNGAGKSTLLKILSQVTGPTKGTLKIKGRIASLLEVGTGFHPELTGKENIYLNGAILGMRKHEINKKLDEIIEFAGVRKYIDTPVKRYSSGMYVRLAFAVAAHLDPDILVVDEVLAVGDADFQKKAIGKMQNISTQNSKTVLFVSHNMTSVRNLCSSGILIENGKITKKNKIEPLVDYYLDSRLNIIDRALVNIDDSFRQYSTLKFLEFVSVERTCEYKLAVDEPIKTIVKLRNNAKIKKARIIGMVNYEDDSRVGLFISKEFDIPQDRTDFKISISLFNHNLSFGKYFLDFNIGSGDFSTKLTDYDVIYNTISFEIAYDNIETKKHINYWRKNWGRNCFKDVQVSLI